MSEIMNKPEPYFKLPLNLSNYKDFYSIFDWSDADVGITFPVSDKIALHWEGADGEKKQFTYKELDALADGFANHLKELGVKKGDRVFFFLPRIPELYYGVLGAVRAGAVVGTLFAAFGTQGAFERLKNSGAKVLVTNSELRKRIEPVRKDLPKLKHILEVDTCQPVGLTSSNHRTENEKQPDGLTKLTKTPSIMMYTSGTSGTPVRGMVLPYSALAMQKLTAQWVLDLHPDDIFWCSADPGWITGLAYGIFGGFLNGVSSVVYEGRFSPEKWYQILQDYKVSVWYTAPTALRMLRGAGEELAEKFDFSHLRHLCTVGEPLEPELVRWTEKVFGVPAHDTYWLTETGAMMIANFPSEPIKPGSMGQPVPGIEAVVLDDGGQQVPPNVEGDLVFKTGWPSQMIGVWENPERFRSYFKGDYFVTGDRAYQDEDGYFWYVGRADDMIKTSGERVGPFEVESALMSHPKVVEAAVVGKPDPVRGQIIKAFVVLKQENKRTPKQTLSVATGQAKKQKNISEELKRHVKKTLAGHAYPREIEFVDELPKTKSGKIVRRVLR